MAQLAAGPPPDETMDEYRPLRGVRVLEVSQVLAGAFACMVLADLGAEVIKIERPGGGDPSRGYGPPFVDDSAYYFHSLNRNKRSIAIALDGPDGQQLLRDLAARSDVLVHNLLPESATALGVTPEVLKAGNPSLIFASVSAYGDIPGLGDKPGLDMLIQAVAGAMSLTGLDENSPVKSAVPIADIAAGLFTVIAVMAALLEQRPSGGSQSPEVQVSLVRSVVASLPFHWGECVIDGRDPIRRGNGHGSIVPYNTFKSADGYSVALAVSSDTHWHVLCEELGLSHLNDDSSLDANSGRVARREYVEKEIGAAMVLLSADQIVKRLEHVGVPIARVNSPADVVRKDLREGWNLFRVQGEFQRDGATRDLLVAASPISFNGRDPSPRAAPRLGQHTLEVLGELGVHTSEIERLVQSGSVQVASSITQVDSEPV